MDGILISDTTTKTCRKCLVVQPIEAFHSRGSGRRPVCKECRCEVLRDQYKDRREQILGRQKKRRQEMSLDERNKRQREYVDKNREHYRELWRKPWHEGGKKAYLKAWKKKNRKKVSAQHRKWVLANQERVREYHREYEKTYRQLKPEKTKLRLLRRKARRLSLQADFNEADMAFAIGYWKNCCPVCGFSFGFVVLNWDHWIPLTLPTCLGTVPKNMIPLCQSCNKSKHDNDPWEWLTNALGTKAKKKSREIREFFAVARKAGQ